MTDRARRLFRQDHPEPADNIFLMMRFDRDPALLQLHQAISTTGQDAGFHVIRADDRDYSGELWTNVSVCIENSMMGIAVFDGMAGHHDSDLNVGIELGYMLALDRSCLILRERRLERMPSMLAHRLQSPFDLHDVDQTVGPVVGHWLRGQRH